MYKLISVDYLSFNSNQSFRSYFQSKITTKQSKQRIGRRSQGSVHKLFKQSKYCQKNL